MTKRHQLLIVTGIFLLLLSTSCQVESSHPQRQADALLIWTGDPMADAGCGYFIRIAGEEYKPSNENLIPQDLRGPATQEVLISYRHLPERIKYSCDQNAGAVGEGIRLYSIRRK